MRVVGVDQHRRDQDDELLLARGGAVLGEEAADDGYIAEKRHAQGRGTVRSLKQTRDRQRLPVSELDRRHKTPRVQA